MIRCHMRRRNNGKKNKFIEFGHVIWWVRVSQLSADTICIPFQSHYILHKLFIYRYKPARLTNDNDPWCRIKIYTVAAAASFSVGTRDISLNKQAQSKQNITIIHDYTKYNAWRIIEIAELWHNGTHTADTDMNTHGWRDHSWWWW